MRTIVAVVALALAACGGSEDGSRFPAVDGRWGIVNDSVVCDGAPTVSSEPDAPPYRVVTCTWFNVNYEGRDLCKMMVVYSRWNASDPWPEPMVAEAADCSAWVRR
jgi:hypothetical protein